MCLILPYSHIFFSLVQICLGVPKEFDFENELEVTGLLGLTTNLDSHIIKTSDMKQNANVLINNKTMQTCSKTHSFPLLP